jgi:hypothetical protein
MKTLATLALTLTLFACGGSQEPSSPPADRAQIEHPYGVVSSDPSVQYFHDALSAAGDDLTGEFGTYLSMLDMNPRDLQQDDPKHAHDVVLEKVRAVEDPVQRARMMLVFFNRAEAP